MLKSFYNISSPEEEENLPFHFNNIIILHRRAYSTDRDMTGKFERHEEEEMKEIRRFLLDFSERARQDVSRILK